MEFHKIVITGGPCSGKTTGLSYIERSFTKKGYKVIILNEAATELILSGYAPNAMKNNYDFEKNILGFQVMKEKYYEESCKLLPDDKVLLVCDRGTMDCKAYATEEEFSAMLKELKLDKIKIRDNYDGVFHLVTAAIGAEEFYTQENNEARRESLDEAKRIDEITLNCWLGHPHLRVIDNSTNFEGKLKRLIKEICGCIGEPVPFEIERKFLIEKPDINFLKSLPNCEAVDIIQTYLTTDGDEVRIRQRGKDGSFIYTLTTKKTISFGKREEHEKRISGKDYLNYMSTADTSMHQIKKTRYLLMWENRYFEIDIYPFSKTKAICEIEMLNIDEEFKIPEFIKIIREVTDDKAFTNYAFAKHIPEEMLK